MTRYDGEPGMEGSGLGSARARAAALLMLALPGAAYVYQGEELGLPEVVDLPDEILTDPIFRRTGSRSRVRDGCRVPLPWSGHASPFGFTAAEEGAAAMAAAARRGSPNTPPTGPLLDPRPSGTSTARPCSCAAACPSSAAGTLRWLESPPDVLAFVRGDGLVCAVNFGTTQAPAPVPGAPLLASGPCPPSVLPGSTAAWWMSDCTA